MTTSFIFAFIGTFFSMMLVDVCWAKYFLSVKDHKPFPSAFWGSMIVLFGALTTLNYVHDSLMLIPAVLGGFVGSYLTVLRESKKGKE